MLWCASCGQENPNGFRFCGACGMSLATPSRRLGEERKVITVLFCDLVGFTARSDQADPEDVGDMLRPYHTRLRAEVERLGGTVDKLIGDAVMAVFGAPVAHEDDPERAVRCALRMLAAIQTLNQSHPALELAVRIGITTGEALVAAPGNQTETVVGDVVNTAARLQGVAPVNGAVVGEPTWRATNARFDFEALEPVTVKGKAQPLALWRVVAARSRMGAAVQPGPAAPFVGRDEELRRLDQHLERSLGRSGDAGIRRASGRAGRRRLPADRCHGPPRAAGAAPGLGPGWGQGGLDRVGASERRADGCPHHGAARPVAAACRVQALLLDRAGGNPLYAEEFVRLLTDRGLLVVDGGTVRLAAEAEIPFPETVQALIAARLDTLPAGAKALLQDAAVLGRVFWSGGLAALSTLDEIAVREQLDQLERRQLVRMSPSSVVSDQAQYAFSHALVRDVAYAQIPRVARARGHRAAAEWLTGLAGERTGDLAELIAHHFTSALALAGATRTPTAELAELAEPARRALVLAGDRGHQPRRGQGRGLLPPGPRTVATGRRRAGPGDGQAGPGRLPGQRPPGRGDPGLRAGHRGPGRPG